MKNEIDLTGFVLIPGFSNYLINKDGRVYTKNYNKIMIPHISNRGYKTLTLCKNGEKHQRSLHRLLAMVFIPNPNNYPLVRHLNDKKGDNRIENLAWGTHLDNFFDKKKNGGVPTENRKIWALKEKDVLSIYKSNETHMVLAEKFGVSVTTIHRVKTKKFYKDFLSKYKPPKREREGKFWRAKLTEKQVIAIFYDTRCQEIIAKDYPVERKTISNIKNKKHYKHITENLEEPGRSKYGKRKSKKREGE